MKVDYKLRNFAELERALIDELPKATSKNVLKRAGTAGLTPVMEAAKRLVPVEDGDLRDSIKIKPVKAKRISRTRFAASEGVTLAVGPTGREEGGNAAWQEFGTVHAPAQPYMRPAADIEAVETIETVGKVLGEQIDKARVRIARKAAKAGS